MTRITEELLKYILAEDGHIIYNEIVTNIQFNDDRAYCYTTQNCFKYVQIILSYIYTRARARTQIFV